MNRHAHPTTHTRRIYDRLWRHQATPRHRVDPSLPWGWLDLPDIPDKPGYKGGVFINGVGFMSHAAAALYESSTHGTDIDITSRYPNILTTIREHREYYSGALHVSTSTDPTIRHTPGIRP